MITDFKEFLNNIIIEQLHPELQNIVRTVNSHQSKQNQIAKKIKELSARGESTGIEGNMPKGSSRAYMKHTEPHEIELDGKKTKIATGTKVAIRSPLDKYHKSHEHDGMSLGNMQNHAENADHLINNTYRILHNTGNNKYKTNNDYGIFPPLIEHDEKHEWAHVGHIRNVNSAEFRKITKMKGYSKGISHREFADALQRDHSRIHGKYWEGPETHEANLDHVENHPLVQKFLDYHHLTGDPPNDLHQIKNMGVFDHPDGSKHIIARDHGFSLDVQKAYQTARRASHKNNW